MLNKLLPSLLLTAGVTAAPAYDSPQHPLTQAQYEWPPYALAIHEFFYSNNTCNPPALRVFKASWAGGRDISAMLGFKYPAGNNCWLDFYTPPVARGPKQVDVFTQLFVVDKCPSTSNQRKVQIGRLEIPAAGGYAKWVDTFGDYLNKPGTSKCPPEGTVEGFELVGVGEDIDLLWTQGQGKGLRILYR